MKLKKNECDEVKQKVKKNHPNSARMNAALSQKIADVEGQVADMERKQIYREIYSYSQFMPEDYDLAMLSSYSTRWAEESNDAYSC